MTFEDYPQMLQPTWTPDGREVAFAVSRGPADFSLLSVAVQGSGANRELGPGLSPVAFERDGNTMLVSLPAENVAWELWRTRVGVSEAKELLLRNRDDGPGWVTNPALSPDGRYVAYQKGTGDAATIFVRTYPDVEGPQQVGSGSVPRWSPKGDRLFYLAGNTLMEVAITTAPSIRVGAPRKLFDVELAPALPFSNQSFDVGPDGETLILVRPLEPIPGIVVVQNLSCTSSSRS